MIIRAVVNSPIILLKNLETYSYPWLNAFARHFGSTFAPRFSSRETVSLQPQRQAVWSGVAYNNAVCMNSQQACTPWYINLNLSRIITSAPASMSKEVCYPSVYNISH